MSERRNMQDFEARAAAYDRVLPHFEPVTGPLLGHLPELEDGALVLDVACATGEPGLTLARRSPGLRVLGIDNTTTMVEVARHKAATEPVPNAHFEVMDAEKLDLADDSVAAVISRLGLLMFGEPATSAAEMARVLAPGGWYSLVVWDQTRLHTPTDLVLRALGEVLRADEMPDFGWLDELAAPGRREQWLRDAGVSSVYSELFRWVWEEPDFAAVREWLTVGAWAPLFLDLDADKQARVYRHLEGLVSEYRTPAGSYKIPVAWRLLWGQA